MKKVIFIGVLCFGIFLSVLGSPNAASAAGACLTDKPGLSEFDGLGATDLLARLIYSEAGGESLTGKRAVAHVVNNRVSKNLSDFGGSNLRGVILKPGEFAGMTSSRARCPSTSLQSWKDSLAIAQNNGSNPIGKALWFNTNSLYNSRTEYIPVLMTEAYTFDGGRTYSEVVEKVIIGGHTFFRVYPY